MTLGHLSTTWSSFTVSFTWVYSYSVDLNSKLFRIDDIKFNEGKLQSTSIEAKIESIVW